MKKKKKKHETRGKRVSPSLQGRSEYEASVNGINNCDPQMCGNLFWGGGFRG